MLNSTSRLRIFAAAIAAATAMALAAAPPGWFLAGNQPANYDTGVDPQALNNGRPSAYLKAKSDQAGFGTLMQNFAAESYLGKRVRFSGFVKSAGVTRWAGLWMRVDGKQGTAPLSFDNMQNRAITGTTVWQLYEVVLDVPQGATGIFFGILLDGPGEVWLNSTNFEVVSAAVPTTDKLGQKATGPTNLSFDK
jgi:hypothetical protein